MNYLYDILLNFNSKLYEVFEWEKIDVITHIRKIPFFKVESWQLFELINYKVELSPLFLSQLYKKTECFSKNRISNIDYAFLITDGKEVVAIKCNTKGIIGYSKLLYEEELEALEYSNSLRYKDIDYNVISKLEKEHFKTRNEIYIRKYIFKELNNLISNNYEDKLNYLYMECFNHKEIKNVKEKIYIELENNWDAVYSKVYDFLKITFQKH